MAPKKKILQMVCFCSSSGVISPPLYIDHRTCEWRRTPLPTLWHLGGENLVGVRPMYTNTAFSSWDQCNLNLNGGLLQIECESWPTLHGMEVSRLHEDSRMLPLQAEGQSYLLLSIPSLHHSWHQEHLTCPSQGS